MKKFIAILATVSMLTAANGSAFASDYGKQVRPVGKAISQAGGKHDLGKFAIGLAIGAGLVGAALAAERQRNSHHHGGYVSVEHGGERGICRVWRNDCRHGDDRACYKFDQRC